MGALSAFIAIVLERLIFRNNLARKPFKTYLYNSSALLNCKWNFKLRVRDFISSQK